MSEPRHTNTLTQIHSRERCKPGQYAGRQLLQLVPLKRKASVGRREETVSQNLAAIAAPSRVRQRERARVTVCKNSNSTENPSHTPTQQTNVLTSSATCLGRHRTAPM